MTRSERLTDRTCKLIREHKIILLRRGDGAYLGQHTCVQAGPDMAHWTYWRACAMDVFNLEWAFAIAKLYGCKVYSFKPKKSECNK